MAQPTLIDDVSDTAFWVAHFRALESERVDALFHDPLAKVLVGERGPMISKSMGSISRYTEWAVISRTVIIDRFIEQKIKNGVDTVINLGAGLDTRPYRMKLPKNLNWIEADYPNIIEHKNRLLKNTAPVCRLSRVSVDLSASEKRTAFLNEATAESKDVLVLTEGVIPYLTPSQVDDLGKGLLEQSKIKFWITEFLDPKVYPYLKQTVRTLKMKNAPFKFYPDDWYGFFKAIGWHESETRYAGEIAVEFKRKPPMPKWAELIMPFIPKKKKQEALRMTGYVVFTRH